MDQAKIGKFIAARRKAQGMTQEALGAKLGVTNKTVSRWETGAYLPDLGKLQPLSDLLGVSVNELLAGERIEDETEFRQKADETLLEALSTPSAFGLQERMAFFRNKWRREHKGYLALWAAVWLLACAAAAWIGQPILWGAVGLLGLFLYGHVRNQMMIYVEAKAFDGNTREPES